jgi:tetratricopeptide (TPR) repeat protein
MLKNPLEIKLRIIGFFLILLPNYSYSQEFIPRLDQIQSIQKDTNNFYFKEIWIKSKDINSNDPEGFLRRASRKIELGYFNEALHDIDQVIKIDSSIGRSYFFRGYILLKHDSIKSAYSNFEKAVVLNDTNIYNFFYLAESSIMLGKYQKAESLYNRIIGKDNKFIYAYFDLANLSMMSYCRLPYNSVQSKLEFLLIIDLL